MSKESIIETLEKVNDVLRADLSIEHKKVRDTMTVRDQFAAAALTGIIADISGSAGTYSPAMCVQAYNAADWMMKARDEI